MTEGGAGTTRSPWEAALTAASIFAVDPIGLGGVAVRSRAGPVRDEWVATLRALLAEETPFRKMPLNASDERLFGGIDLTATLSEGRPVAERGLLADLDRGVLLIPSCERLSPALAARLALAMDAGHWEADRSRASKCIARFSVVALDESEGNDDSPSLALTERLALGIDLSDLSHRDISPSGVHAADICRARDRWARVETPDLVLSSLCAASIALGISSLRAPIFAMRAAKASAALAGREIVSQEDAALAAALVLAHRSTMVPSADETGQQQDGRDQSQTSGAGQDRDEEGDDAPDDRALTDMILAAVQAALPKDLLRNHHGKSVRVPANAPPGKSGSERKNASRGRPAGVRRGLPGKVAQISLIETLRAAAPWQRLRTTKADSGGNGKENGRRDDIGTGHPFPDVTRRKKIEVRRDDIRVKRLKARSQTATIFAVDASGSTALQRLAETKGAIELLLADCYIRRDQVALIAFRGKGADILLSPTRSLTRAKRSLCALAGGGGTPLASGINAASDLALRVRRKGLSPLIVFLTDGKANVASDGGHGRERAQSDATAAGRRLRGEGIAAMLVDTSPRPQPQAERLADAMAARYVPLPYANAASISQAAKLAAKL